MKERLQSDDTLVGWRGKALNLMFQAEGMEKYELWSQEQRNIRKTLLKGYVSKDVFQRHFIIING